MMMLHRLVVGMQISVQMFMRAPMRRRLRLLHIALGHLILGMGMQLIV